MVGRSDGLMAALSHTKIGIMENRMMLVETKIVLSSTHTQKDNIMINGMIGHVMENLMPICARKIKNK